MRTTLVINDAILRELRHRARSTGKPFREVLEENIQRGLAAEEKHEKRRCVRIKPHALGIKPGFRHISLNQVYDQVATEQDAQAR